MTREQELEARLLSVIRIHAEYKKSAESQLRGQRVMIGRLKKKLESAMFSVEAARSVEKSYGEALAELRTYREVLGSGSRPSVAI
jgi:hypothetical protein